MDDHTTKVLAILFATVFTFLISLIISELAATMIGDPGRIAVMLGWTTAMIKAYHREDLF